jgi:polar amino acid transport system substrate-binding protein
VLYLGMMNIQRHVCLLLASILLSVSSLVSAQAEEIKEELTIAGSEWPPYVSTQLYENGLATLLTKEALSRSGHTSTMRVLPWSEALRSVIDGDVDIITSIWRTTEREQDLLFSNVILSNYIIFVKHNDSSIRYNDIADLQGLKVGVVADYAYSDEPYDTTGIDIVSSGSVRENLEKLRARELDLVLADGRVALYEIDQLVAAKELTMIRRPLLTRGLRIAVSRKNPAHEEIIDAFNKNIAEMQVDGTYNAILATFRISE